MIVEKFLVDVFIPLVAILILSAMEEKAAWAQQDPLRINEQKIY